MNVTQPEERWLQVTAGKGPVECAWAVVQVVEEIHKEAQAAGVISRTVEIQAGPEPGTADSALIAIGGSGQDLDGFVRNWRGTVQWIARSPFRPEHKRKNWFVGVEILEPIEETHFDAKDMHWETMRASGPGGQHVNRTESAVRVTHLPTGMQAIAAEERSQHRNRKLALARLATRIDAVAEAARDAMDARRWRAHQELERGNALRVFRA